MNSLKVVLVLGRCMRSCGAWTKIGQPTVFFGANEQQRFLSDRIDWLNRTTSRLPNKPTKPRKDASRQDRTAEEYSRRRRAKRVNELKRNAKELRESRRGYNLPKSTSKARAEMEASYNARLRTLNKSKEENSKIKPSNIENTSNKSIMEEGSINEKIAREWREKIIEMEEAKHWHSWSTCPSARDRYDYENDVDTREPHKPKPTPRKTTK